MNIKQRVNGFITENASFIFSVPTILWQILFLYIPLLLVIYMSFKSAQSSSIVEFTLANYAALIKDSYFYIILRSALIAAAVTIICLICAYPTAYFIALKVTSRLKHILLFLLTLPFWTNFLIQVYSWVFILDHNGLLNTILLKMGLVQEPLHMINNVYAIFVVMVYYYIPFMLMPLYSILEKLQPELCEASMDLGATHWQTFKRVTLPLSLSGIKTGVFLVFVPAFGEFVIPSIVGGGKYMFVGSLISHYFLVVRDSQLGAAFTVVSGLVLITCAFLFHRLCRVPSYIISNKEMMP